MAAPSINKVKLAIKKQIQGVLLKFHKILKHFINKHCDNHNWEKPPMLKEFHPLVTFQSIPFHYLKCIAG